MIKEYFLEYAKSYLTKEENIDNFKQLEQEYIDALNNSDYNVLMVDMAIFTTIGLLAGIILDLSYGFIDPRIRMGEKR